MGFPMVYNTTKFKKYPSTLGNFLARDEFLGGTGSKWYGSKFSWTFGNLLSMDFPVVYDTTILNEHPLLVIFGTRTNFWSGQEVGRADQKII